MENVATMRRMYELLNDGDIDGFGGLVAGGFVEHEEVPGLEPTKEGVLQMFRMYRAAFPDLHTALEDVLVDGDRVVVRGTDRGTHLGDFMGFPASGRKVTTTWIEIFRMENGKAAEGWLESDSATLRAQLAADAG